MQISNQNTKRIRSPSLFHICMEERLIRTYIIYIYIYMYLSKGKYVFLGSQLIFQVLWTNSKLYPRRAGVEESRNVIKIHGLEMRQWRERVGIFYIKRTQQPRQTGKSFSRPCIHLTQIHPDKTDLKLGMEMVVETSGRNDVIPLCFI